MFIFCIYVGNKLKYSQTVKAIKLYFRKHEQPSHSAVNTLWGYLELEAHGDSRVVLVELLYTVHCTLYNLHNTKYTEDCTHNLHYTIYTIHCTLYSVHCTIYTIQFTLYSVQCTLYTVHCITVHCSSRVKAVFWELLYNVLYTIYPYNVHCAVFTSTISSFMLQYQN